MAEDRAGVNQAVLAVIDGNEQEVDVADPLLQDAAGIAVERRGHVGMYVGHQRVGLPRIGGALPEQLRIPAVVLGVAAAAVLLDDVLKELRFSGGQLLLLQLLS